jgi:four helix bundle protein
VESIKEKKAVKDFTDLVVWQHAHQIRISVYTMAKSLPPEEKFNLSSQIKRSAASIGANIAEGYGRFSYQENIQFCRQARGSLDETRDHLIFIQSVCPDLKKDCDTLIASCLDCRQLLNGYINYLKKRKAED